MTQTVPGASAALNLVAQVVGIHAGARGHLELSGAVGTSPRPAAEAHLELSAHMSAALAGVAVVTADAIVTHPGPLSAAWEFLLNLPTPGVLALFGYLVQEVHQVLADPDTALVSLLVSLPILALIVRRLNMR